MDRDNIFQLATSNPEITEDQQFETSLQQSWWLPRHPGEETSCNSRSSARSWPAPSPTFQVLRWVASFCFLTSTFIMIIFISKKRNFLKNMLQGLMRCFEAQNPSVHEILYYHKNSTGIWLEVLTAHPIMRHCDHEDAIQHRHLLKWPMSSMNIQNPHRHSLDHLVRSRWFQSRTRQTWLSSSSATTETSPPSRWPAT